MEIIYSIFTAALYRFLLCFTLPFLICGKNPSQSPYRSHLCLALLNHGLLDQWRRIDSMVPLVHIFSLTLFILASRASWGWSILISMVRLQPLVLVSDSSMLTLIRFNDRICGNAWFHFHCFATSFHGLLPICLAWFVGSTQLCFHHSILWILPLYKLNLIS